MNITSFLSRISKEPPSVRPFARVERTISGYYPGRVYFQSTYWPARLDQPQFLDRLLPGTMVKVLGRDGLTLLVAPVQHPQQNVYVQLKRRAQRLPVPEPMVLSR